MKLTIVLLIATMMQVSATGFAQKLTLNQNRVSVKQIFKEIKKQTGYDVFYLPEMMNDKKTIAVNFSNAPLEMVMEKCLEGQPLVFSIFEKSIVVKKDKTLVDKVIDYFLNIDVKGKITDQDGNPLPQASIKIKGTDRAVISNEKGEFLLTNVDENAVVEISYLGYTTKELKVAKQMGNISLTMATGKLDEVSVVSTGYQTLPKERATGSFTTVDNKLFNEQVGTDVLSRLEFITNGVSVFRNNATATSQLMVRGLSTINGPTAPLIILDNFPYEGDINNLNPNDVETVTVLKDAAAASIWGTRAGNGVIVITTKKGKYNQGLKVEINSNVTIGRKPDLDYLTPMSSNDYINFEQFLYNKGYYDSKINSTQYPVISPVVDILAKQKKGEITSEQADKQINALRNLDVRNDFSRYIYEPSVNQQYYANVRGGSENLTYNFSTGYDKNTSNLSANYDKLNFRSDVAFKPTKQLQLIASLNYTISDNKSGKSGYNIPLPYEMLADINGNPLSVNQTYSQAFKNKEVSKGQLLDWNYYPLSDYEHTGVTTNITDFLANFGANYKIWKGLNFDIKFQYERQQSAGSTLYVDQSYFARNLIYIFTQIDGTTIKNNIPRGGILDQQNGLLISQGLRGQLNFDHSWSKHTITLLAGEELRSVNNSGNTFRTYGYNGEILTSSSVDYKTLFPNYVTKSNTAVSYLNSFSGTLNRFVSLYANGAYTYDSKYTISGSMRRDASNIFGVATNDKWTPLWSVGLGWEISKEKFFSFDTVPYLKLRATTGYSGNVDPSKVAVTTISYNSNNSIYTNTPVSQISNFSNPDLRWEKVKTTNFGLDFRAKNNRVSGSIDYYLKKATDLYATVPIDYTVGLGAATITKNVASMQGKGLDIEINSVNIKRAIEWNTTLNLNYYKDEVTQYYLSTTNGSNYVGDNRYPVERNSVWGIYSYKSAGLDATGNPQGYLNGVISENYSAIIGTGTQISDLKYNGPRFPILYGSLGNTIRYRDVSLSIRLTYGFGNYFRRQSINYSSLASSGVLAAHSDYANRWQNTGDELNTSVPSFVYPLETARDGFYTGSETLIEKADNIRLQYITLSYNLSKKQYSWLPFSSLLLYMNANNLGILWRANKFGIDPDYSYTNRNMPNPKNFAFGLRVNL